MDKLRAKKNLIWLMIFLAGIILGRFIPLQAGLFGGTIRSAEEKRSGFLIFLIDFNDFMCMSCLDSFLEFYQALPPPFQSEHAIGILAVDRKDQEENRSRYQKIVKRKLNGFMQGNRINFPVFIDSDGSFTFLSDKGTAVVVFTEGGDRIRDYSFPLSALDREEIFRTLLQIE
jgi:hypothetical protein